MATPRVTRSALERVSPRSPRAAVPSFDSDAHTLAGVARVLGGCRPDLHRGGTHSERSFAARARTPQQTAWTACNDLLDHLVGEREQPVWNLEAECLGGLEADHQFASPQLTLTPQSLTWILGYDQVRPR
jgi:hypothetical protein